MSRGDHVLQPKVESLSPRAVRVHGHQIPREARQVSHQKHDFKKCVKTFTFRFSTLNSFMKSVCGSILGGKLKNYVSSEESESFGIEEFLHFYRSVLNNQKNQSELLTFVFFKVDENEICS